MANNTNAEKSMMPNNDAPDNSDTARDELHTFLFLTIILAPLITIVIVGGYGFLVWMAQLILGPPS